MFILSFPFQEPAVKILTRNGSLNTWPVILKPLLSHDTWEITPDEVTIYEETPLGKGFYGEVHKGVLNGRRHRIGSKKGSRGPRYSLANTVAIKRLKSEFE